MTKKQLSLFILISVVVASPLLSGAESRERAPNKSAVQEKIEREEKRELIKKLEDDKRMATNTDGSTSSPKLDRQKDDAKARTIQAATNIFQKTTKEISRLKNIIDRLTNKNSIVVKLDAHGVNTTTIKEKLVAAKILIDKAEIDLLSAKNLISTVATSSDPSLKTRVIGTRKLFEQANSNLKLAITKIKEANKLIREIPGVREIEKTTASTAASTTISN